MIRKKETWDLLNTSRKRNNSKKTNGIAAITPQMKSILPVTTTQDVLAQRSQSFAYGTNKNKNSNTTASAHLSTTVDALLQKPIVYAAFLSKIAVELRQRITVSDHFKDDIEYKNTFEGKEVVDKIVSIIQTSDRKLALRIGRALSSQRFFHDVSYETQLIDSSVYLYEYTNRTLYTSNSSSDSSPYSSNGGDCWSESESLTGSTVVHQNNPNTIIDSNNNNSSSSNIIPNGILTDLTHCYSPTCWDVKPCYSPLCPKRFTQLRQKVIENNGTLRTDLKKSFSTPIKNGKLQKTSSTSSSHSATTHHDYWADYVDKSLYESLSKTECKRQENLYELIYTEKDYVASLDYLQTMWIKPLTERPIIPASRRDSFIRKVFGDIEDIYKINIRLLQALQERQQEHAIIYQIGDLLLDFVVDFEPYIKYGSKQYEAKSTLETERCINPNFDVFVEATERHVSSLKLELNGYLTKPTTRLGRYTLLFNEVLKHTPADHPDLEDLPKAITIIKGFLSRVNAETGMAKNRFDLERIHYNLSFKFKADEMDLDLLNKNRQIIKQGTLKKAPQLESVEYQVVLFDHYLVVAKLKMMNGMEKFVVQKRPIPIELLSVYLPEMYLPNHTNRVSTLALPRLTTTVPTPVVPAVHIRASTDLGPHTNSTLATTTTKSNHYPIAFKHLGRTSNTTHFTLYTSSLATRRPWLEKIKAQQEEKNKKSPIFEIIPVISPHIFLETNKINHFITFNGGQQFLLAADDGVYVGHHNHRSTDYSAHKVLALEKVTHIQTIESTATLLILADRTLWEYPLDVVNGKPETQPCGKLVRHHVPFFYVGTCVGRLLVCVPRISTLKTVITAFEATKLSDIGTATSSVLSSTETSRKRSSSVLGRLLSTRKSNLSDDLHLKKFKNYYVPCETYKLELLKSMMLITTSKGMIMIDMRSDHPQQLLNPGDQNLSFIIEREKEVTSSLSLRQPVKRIAIFRTPRNNYFLCYDEYAFYIDNKGNRLFMNFLIEWEGTPESFAFSYPYVLAFDSSFIEIRNVITGSIEQIIRGKHMKCLNNGHKTELPLIFGSMLNPEKASYQDAFKIQLVTDHSVEQDTLTEPSTLRRS